MRIIIILVFFNKIIIKLIKMNCFLKNKQLKKINHKNKKISFFRNNWIYKINKYNNFKMK